jgi:hypothetical protein
MTWRMRLWSARGIGALVLVAGAAVLAAISVTAEPHGCEGDAQLRPAAASALFAGVAVLCLPTGWRRRWHIAAGIISALFVWIALWVHAFAGPSTCEWWR